MGIGGSGMSGVAILAKENGYEVEGSDLQESTPYLDKVKKSGIKTYVGHDTKQLEDVDILAVTAAAFFRKDTSIIDWAKENDIEVIQWQEFLGKYLCKGKKLISIAGTHGKSTTTSMISLLLEKAGVDPSVMIGATIHEWDGNFRVGGSDYYVVESDEFYDNFLNYNPDIIILNNIEYDHPDYFNNEEQLFDSFERFIKKIRGDKVLIFNADDAGIKKLFDSLGDKYLSQLNLIGYSIKGSGSKHTENIYDANIVEHTPKFTRFVVKHGGAMHEYKLKIPGDYNVSNALGLIALSDLLGIDAGDVSEFLKGFNGVGRRMDIIGEKNGITVYEDYAHHPTALKLTLDALKQRHPDSRLVCVYEPHSFSRTKALFDSYRDAFNSADVVYVTPIYKARDKENFGMSADILVENMNHKSATAFDSIDEIPSAVAGKSKSGDVIVVMGAGNSYQLARDILVSI